MKLCPADLFRLEIPGAPAVSREGSIAYLRRRSDAQTDEACAELWIILPDGSRHRRLAPEEPHVVAFAWSPCGSQIAYVVRTDKASAHRLMTIDVATGAVCVIVLLAAEARMLVWAPNGERIAFVMGVKHPPQHLVEMPLPPAGASWAPRAKYIDRSNYRMEGVGLIDHTDRLFTVPSAGGDAERVGDVELRGGGLMPNCIAWTRDSAAILFSSTLDDNWDADLFHSDIASVDVGTGEVKRLTSAPGTYGFPVPSPDGQWIVCVGFEDQPLFHLQTRLWIMRADGSELRTLLSIDRDLLAPAWDASGSGVYFSFFNAGVDKLGYVDLQGHWREVADSIGGLATPNINLFGTEYGVGADFLAVTTSAADAPPQIAVVRDGRAQAITTLNEHWLPPDALGKVEEVRWASSFDGREIQGWIVRPPGFDPAARHYPLIVEIHGGPNAAYGPKFSFAFQTWAAAGYVVFYPNYRGSTSYGGDFVDLTQFDYPQHEHHDILAGVQAVKARGGIDAESMFILGSSAGGTLTAWTIGKSNEFCAAVVQHPFINFSSFTLSWDLAAPYARRWARQDPWEDPAWAWAHSPLSLAGDIHTPTLVIVGDRDYRTPPGEGEQLYQALKLRGVEAALLIREGVGHVLSRPSQDIEMQLHIMRWFDLHRRR